MQEYKLIEDNNNFYLLPLIKCDHAIIFKDSLIAHQFKIAIGLGTHPGPNKSPGHYKKLTDQYIGNPVYEPILPLGKGEDWASSSCCQSGCPGCPWYKN